MEVCDKTKNTTMVVITISSTKILLGMGNGWKQEEWNSMMFSVFNYQCPHTIHQHHFPVLGFHIMWFIHFSPFLFFYSLFISISVLHDDFWMIRSSFRMMNNLIWIEVDDTDEMEHIVQMIIDIDFIIHN